MTFDKWFNEQSRLIQVLLLLIPVVGWIVEILVRLSAVLRNASTENILGLVIFGFFNFWILGIVDLIYLILNGKLILCD